MNAIKILLTILGFTTILSCSNDPTDPTDPCTDKKIVGFSTTEFPTSPFGIRQVNLTFGEFNGSGNFTATANPTQLVSINRPSPNDANAYNSTLKIYSFLMKDTHKIINYNMINNSISEVDLPVGFDYCNGLTYSPITDKYYTVQMLNSAITLFEFNNITSSPIVFSNSRVLYSGTDASDATFYQAHVGLITDGLGKLYILLKKNLISLDITNFTNATLNYHNLNNNSFTSSNAFSGLEYDSNNNRLLFIRTNYSSSYACELREVPLPLGNSAYGNLVVDLSSYYAGMDFNLEFHSTILACNGSYIITNHKDNQVNLETKIITIETNNTINIIGTPTHIFGIQTIN